jgi:hypothetical protein
MSTSDRPARVSALAWKRAQNISDASRRSRLKKLAGLRFLAGMSPDEAVIVAIDDLDGDIWTQSPRRDVLDLISDFFEGGDLRRTNGEPPKHVKEAAEAILSAVSHYRPSPADDDKARLKQAWGCRPIGYWTACSACGGALFPPGTEITAQRWPAMHDGLSQGDLDGRDCGKKIAVLAKCFSRAIVELANAGTLGVCENG